MEFQKSITELIKERKSTRTFDSKEIDEYILKKMQDYITIINNSSNIKARFILINNKNTSNNTSEKLGTYGIISGANTFIIGILNKYEKDAVSFGYLFEKIILYATDLGLQTCWLGGTFKKSDYEQKSSLTENEFIPIISPLGIKKEKVKFLDKTMRKLVGANNRKPWNELFYENDLSLPLTEKSANNYAIPIEMVRLGPSASNKQPWRIIKDNNLYHFYLCKTKGYGVADFDMQKNDLGIAKCHFELVAKELDLKGKWDEIQGTSAPTDWEYVYSWISAE